MQINRYTDQSLLIIEPVGDMGLYNLGELRALLQKLRETQSLKVVIDMGKVPGIDSITIGFLLQETTLFTEGRWRIEAGQNLAERSQVSDNYRDAVSDERL
jgi:anti-anti-sigma factor